MHDETMTVEAFATQQMKKRIDLFDPVVRGKKAYLPVVTVCMEPGSGGHLIAEGVAKRMNFNLYDKSILVPIAHSADVESKSLEAIEKERPGGVQDFVTSLLGSDYVYTGDYTQHLRRIVEVIGTIGHAVIVGRGANFILAPENRFSVRVVAPMDIRIANVSYRFGVSESQAKKRIKHRESRRKAFIKDTFRKNIEDVLHYDLVINTARLGLDAAVEAVIATMIGAQADGALERAEAFILENR